MYSALDFVSDITLRLNAGQIALHQMSSKYKLIRKNIDKFFWFIINNFWKNFGIFHFYFFCGNSVPIKKYEKMYRNFANKQNEGFLKLKYFTSLHFLKNKSKIFIFNVENNIFPSKIWISIWIADRFYHIVWALMGA